MKYIGSWTYGYLYQYLNLKFIPFRAVTTNLWVKDKTGVKGDVILGYVTADRFVHSLWRLTFTKQLQSLV